MGVGWNLPQDDVLCLSIVSQLLSDTLFFAFGGKEWNLDLGTRKSPSSQSSHLLALSSLPWTHPWEQERGPLSSAEMPPSCFCAARVIYANMDKAVLFKSVFFFSFPSPKWVQFLEAVFSNSFMLYFCSFQLTVALYIVPSYVEHCPVFSASPASYLHLSPVHLRSIANVNVLTSPVGQASHLTVSWLKTNTHKKYVCWVSCRDWNLFYRII